MSANKEGELPAADSCGLAEGEEPEDEVAYTHKPSLLGKLRAIATKVCVVFFFFFIYFFLLCGCSNQ